MPDFTAASLIKKQPLDLRAPVHRSVALTASVPTYVASFHLTPQGFRDSGWKMTRAVICMRKTCTCSASLSRPRPSDLQKKPKKSQTRIATLIKRDPPMEFMGHVGISSPLKRLNRPITACPWHWKRKSCKMIILKHSSSSLRHLWKVNALEITLEMVVTSQTTFLINSPLVGTGRPAWGKDSVLREVIDSITVKDFIVYVYFTILIRLTDTKQLCFLNHHHHQQPFRLHCMMKASPMLFKYLGQINMSYHISNFHDYICAGSSWLCLELRFSKVLKLETGYWYSFLCGKFIHWNGAKYIDNIMDFYWPTNRYQVQISSVSVDMLRSIT